MAQDAAKHTPLPTIRHALTMLKPGSRLVAICANGSRQNGNLKPLAIPGNHYRLARSKNPVRALTLCC